MRAEDAIGRSVLPKGRKARALLALLALAAPRPLLRSHLISLLWSKRESNNALGSLRQSLHELQAALDTIPTRFFQNDRTRVAMRSEGLEVILTPADAFDRSILLEDLGGIDQALDLYLSTERAHLNQRSMSEAQATLSPAKEPPATLALFDQPRPVVAEATTLVAPAAGSSQRMRIGISAFRASPGMLAPAFALGLTEELVLALEPFRWMSCVPLFLRSEEWADSGAFRLLRNPELDCVVEGSVQEVGARLRIVIRVLDLRNGGEVAWVHRFDRGDDNPLLAQEEVAAEAAARIEARLQLWEARHAMAVGGPNPTVRGLLCASLTRLFRLDRADFIKAGEQLEQALRLDPGNPTTNVWLAQWHLFALGQGWAADPASSTHRARDLARLALTLAPDDGQALALAGHVQAFVEKEPGEAMRLLDLAIEANPNAAIGWCRSAMASSYAGQHDIAVERAERARGMSSEHPLGFMFEGALAVPLLLRGDYERAVTAGERSIALNPDFSSSFKTQLAALGHLGRREDADRIRARLLRLEPGFSIAQAMERSPLRVATDRERYAEGLRLGGLR